MIAALSASLSAWSFSLTLACHEQYILKSLQRSTGYHIHNHAFYNIYMIPAFYCHDLCLPEQLDTYDDSSISWSHPDRQNADWSWCTGQRCQLQWPVFFALCSLKREI